MLHIAALILIGQCPGGACPVRRAPAAPVYSAPVAYPRPAVQVTASRVAHRRGIFRRVFGR